MNTELKLFFYENRYLFCLLWILMTIWAFNQALDSTRSKFNRSLDVACGFNFIYLIYIYATGAFR